MTATLIHRDFRAGWVVRPIHTQTKRATSPVRDESDKGLLTNAFNGATLPFRWIWHNKWKVAAYTLVAIGIACALKIGVFGLGSWGWGMKGTGAAAATSSGPVATTVTEAIAKTPEALEVLLDNGSYYTRTPGDTAISWASSNLESIADTVSKLPGTDQGIKVFVQRSKEATAGDKADLFNALSHLVKPHDIMVRQDFIPSPVPH